MKRSTHNSISPNMTFLIQFESQLYTKKITELVCANFANAKVESIDKFNVNHDFLTVDKLYIFVDQYNFKGLSIEVHKNGIPKKNIFMIMVADKIEYSVECIRNGFYDYLLLNSLEFDFKFFSDRVNNQLTNEDQVEVKNHIVIKDHKSITKLQFNQIVFIEAYGSYSNLYTNNKFYTISKTIKSIIHNFPESFVRVHRSYAVNLEHVKSFSADEVIMKNDTRIKISRAKKMALLEAIQNTA